MNWISVKTKLPDWYQWVLAYNPYLSRPFQARRVETGMKDDEGESKWKWDTNLVDVLDIGVSHWMPLPALPPRGDDDNAAPSWR